MFSKPKLALRHPRLKDQYSGSFGILKTERRIPCRSFGERTTTIFMNLPPFQLQNKKIPMMSIKTQRTNTRN